MPTSKFGFARLLWVVGVFALSDCSCKDKPGLINIAKDFCSDGTKVCSTDLQCADHEACGNAAGNACCTYSARTCSDSSECCPGQICKRDHHCFDLKVECPNGDADCGDPGSDRVCTQYTDKQNKKFNVCDYAPCGGANGADAGANGGCPEGQACFKNFCVASAPCNGHCDDGSICIPQNNQCWSFGGRCTVSCSPGHLAVEVDVNNIWDSCNNRSGVACECAELPPIKSHDLGRYSSSTAVGATQVAVSMYDGEFGDLVVRFYGTNGQLTQTEYVDGVPTSGTVVAGPSGARGGIQEPGDDVGLYTSIAAATDGTVFVSYYDQTHGDLKLATRTPAGAWSTQVVDSIGDVGLYTSLAIDSTGKPGIAYYMRAGATGIASCPGAAANKPDLVTAVKYAHAKSLAPASASDWTIGYVECGARPAPSCYGCTSGQTCVTSAAGVGVCATAAAGCTGCTSAQVCGTVSGGPAACQTAFTSKPLLAIPVGVGLFPSLAYQSSNALIAYYDAISHSLKAASGTTTFTPVLIDGAGAGSKSTDTGLFPSLAVETTGAKRTALAWHDASFKALHFTFLPSLTAVANPPGPDFVIDTGHEPAEFDGPSFVGANVDLHFTADGKLFASYQNSTAGDLRLAQYAPAGWTVKKQWKAGALGFYSHITQLPGVSPLYISHAQVHAKLEQNHPVKDNTLHMETYTP